MQVKRRAAIATLLVAAWAVSSPSTAQAAGPARVSVGVSTNYLAWKLVSERNGDSTSGDDVFGFGLTLSANLHRLFYVQSEFVFPYEVSTVIGSSVSNPDGLVLADLQLVGGNLLLFSRPVGQTMFAPVIGAGIAYRHTFGGYYLSDWDAPEQPADEVVDDQFQPMAAAGLSWNSGWDSGSTHIDAQARVYGPPSQLASAGNGQNPFNPLSSWAWSLWLGCRLSVL